MKFAKSYLLCVYTCIVWTQRSMVKGSTTTESSTAFVGTTTSSQVTTDSTTVGTQSTSASISSSTVVSTEENNSTATTSTTTQLSNISTSITTTVTSTTTQMVVHCKNGTCVGNESSCLNETITDTCMLGDTQSCYQIVYTNETDTYYEVGCSSNCEYLLEDAGPVTKTTRCCDTNMCNNELLSDPDKENSAVQKSLPYYPVLLLVYLSRFLN